MGEGWDGEGRWGAVSEDGMGWTWEMGGEKRGVEGRREKGEEEGRELRQLSAIRVTGERAVGTAMG